MQGSNLLMIVTMVFTLISVVTILLGLWLLTRKAS